MVNAGDKIIDSRDVVEEIETMRHNCADAAAESLRMDYIPIDFYGEEYWARS